MDGMDWDKLPDDIKQDLVLAQSSKADTEAEELWLTKEYQPLIDHYEAVEASNRAYQAQCMSIMQELDEEMGGDL